jgi:ATP-dependent DNA ligase
LDSGDLGDIAMRSRSTQRTMFQPAPLNVREVYKKLRAIASEHGSAVCQSRYLMISVSAAFLDALSILMICFLLFKTGDEEER